MSEPNPKNTISRRDFVIKGGLGALGFAVSAASGSFVGAMLAEMAKNRSIETTGNQLKATLAAMEQNNEQTSFHPEGNFTNELFEKVRNSTYALRTETKRGLYSATSWCPRMDDESIYLATNKHVVDGESITGISFWRPNVDTRAIVPAKFEFASSETSDIAVIKCDVRQTKEFQQEDTLAFRDEYDLSPGTKILIVGFPGEFIEASKGGPDFPISGEVTSVEMKLSDNLWVTKALINPGHSGSPVVILDEQGGPIVIGMIYSYGKVFQENDKTISPITRLEIAPLIKELA